MIKTLSIRDLESKANSIYEAIVVLAKRARQINDDQKQLLMREREYDDDYDEFNEDEVDFSAAADYVDLPKPTDISLEEFIEQKIKYDYPAESENESRAE